MSEIIVGPPFVINVPNISTTPGVGGGTGGGGGVDQSYVDSRDAATLQAAKDYHDSNPSGGGGGGAVDSVNGKTGAVTLTKADIGLGSVDNTTDAAKPVSTATQAALDGKANTNHSHDSAQITDLTEAVQDIVGAFIKAGVGTTVSYDDAANTFTINATGGDSGGGETDPEIVRDVIGAALVAGAGVQITYDDASDIITVSSTAVLPTRKITAGTGLTGGGDLGADRTLAVDFGTVAGKVADGGVVQSIQDALAQVSASGTLSVEDFGAVDNTSDSTSAIQAAIDACPDYGTVTGWGKEFRVTRLVLDRPITLKGIRLRSRGSAVNDASVINIGAYNDTRERYDITIEDVEIDGRRVQHTNIDGDEDGARHGIRIVGRVRNINIRRVWAHDCATDGISLFHGLGMGGFLSTSASIMQEVRIEDSKFTMNRRHGGSSSSSDRLYVKNSIFDGNGTDLGLSEGQKGARRNNVLYGNGWDAEEYAPTTWHGSHVFVDCTFLRNASRGFLAHQPGANDSAATNWTARGPFALERCILDSGTGSGTECAAFVTLNASAPRHYSKIALIDCILRGQVYVQSAQDVRVDGGTITTGGTTAVVLLRVDRAQVMLGLGGKSIYTEGVGTLASERQSGETIFIPASEITDVNPASPTLTRGVQAKNVWVGFPKATVMGVCTAMLEAGWSKVSVDVLWAPADSTTGVVAWRLDVGLMTPGTTLADPPNGPVVTVNAPSAAWKIMQTSLGNTVITGGSPATLELLRLGGVAGTDTYAATVHVLGLLVTRLS